MKGKIFLTAKLRNISPLRIGSGEAENTDADILLDSDAKPYIPASAFSGVLRREFDKYGYKDLADIFWGKSEKTQSLFSCNDLTLNSSYTVTIRDNIAIESKTGLTKETAKFDSEVLDVGALFQLFIEVDIKDSKEKSLQFIAVTKEILKKGISIGAKTASGFGSILLESFNCTLLDFSKKEDILLWVKKDFSRKDNPCLSEIKVPLENRNELVIEADFDIKNSLLIKNHYDSFLTEFDLDAVHLKSGNQNIISGTSLKGAIRARAEKIINTITGKIDDSYVNNLFGFVEKDEKGKEVPNGKSEPSRVFVNEVPINKVSEELQARIKIDRFTGGTIEGALFDSLALFPQKSDPGNSHIKHLTIKVENPSDEEFGLMLLILKDLWTEDLPIGSEKNIGRGVLTGKKAAIQYKGKKYDLINSKEHNKEEVQFFDKCIKSFNETVKKNEVKNV